MQNNFRFPIELSNNEIITIELGFERQSTDVILTRSGASSTAICLDYLLSSPVKIALGIIISAG